jgi:predicted esterase
MHTTQSSRAMHDKVVGHRGRHRGTVILLHGMYGSAKDFNDLSVHLSHMGCRCILMSAPRRTVHWPSGAEEDITSWYDYYTRKDGEEEHDTINLRHLETQTERLVTIVKTEMRRIHPTRIFVGGCSQGGTVAMHACATGALKYIGGALSLRACFMHSLVKTPLVKDLNLLVFAGSSDDVYTLSLQRTAFGVFEQHGANVQWVVKNGLKHHSPSSSEMTCSIQFICSLIK